MHGSPGLFAAIAAGLLIGTSSAARAESLVDETGAAGPGVAVGDVSVRSMQSNWMILPRGDEFGFNLRFVTAPAGPGGERLRFSDLVVGRLHMRHALGGRAELYAGTDVLPKQPADQGESVWQGSHAGARLGFGPSLAGFVRLGGGPVLGGGGRWGGLSAGLAGRKRIHDAVTLQGGADAAATGLFYGEDRPRQWLAEAGGHLDVIFFTPIQDFIYWFGFAYSIPVGSGQASSAKMPAPAPMNPQPRVGFEVGAAFAAGERWDVYLAYSVLDRGEADDPATTLPILDGGFDQRQMVFGLIRRFGTEPARSEYLVR